MSEQSNDDEKALAGMAAGLEDVAETWKRMAEEDKVQVVVTMSTAKVMSLVQARMALGGAHTAAALPVLLSLVDPLLHNAVLHINTRSHDDG